MKLPIGTQINKYVLQKYKGGGSFGDVYKAEDRATNSVCALKCIEVDPTTPVALVLQEAQALKACQSQHIVYIASADVVIIGGSTVVLIDMEYLKDGSLEKKISKHGISYADALCAGRHMLLGLSAAHKNGIIHKDLKPANIMIAGSVYKLSDFGISYIKRTAVSMGLTYEPNAAPELSSGQTPDERTDIYAAGMTLFRICMLKGSTAIDDQTITDWENSGKVAGLPEFIGFPNHFPRRLKTVIQKATAADPAYRYQTAGEMLTALEKLKVVTPWRRVNKDEWSADQNANVHKMKLLRRASDWELCYTVNDRRRNKDCSAHKTEQAALTALESRIAKSTL